VNEQAELTFTASATDADLPGNSLSFSLVGAPEGAVIDAATGAFSWTPTEAQGPGSYSFTVRVTDDGSPNLFDEETIDVLVNEVNMAPVLAPIGNQEVDEQVLFTFTAMATDADLPANSLSFSLLEAPEGAAIDAATGVFTWTPAEAVGAGVVGFTVRVTDGGGLFDEEFISVGVREVNVAPVLAPIGGRSVSEGELLTFTVGASDADLPANALTLSATGLPAGASFDPATGVFSWMPAEDQGPATYAGIQFQVTDAAGLTASETISIAVLEDASLDAGPQAGDGAPDTFRLVRNGANLEGYLNGGLVFVRAFDALPQVTVSGSTDDDTLIIDLAGGDPIPAAGIAYAGGGPGDHDTLSLTGGAVDSLEYTVFDAHSGTVSVDGKMIAYTGLEPIVDNLAAANRTFVFGPAADQIQVAIGGARTQITSPSSESVDFANPSGTLTIRGGDGDDTIVVTGDPAFEVLIDAGAGNDNVGIFDIFVKRNATILMGAGNDVLEIFSSDGDGQLRMYGGPGKDTLNNDMGIESKGQEEDVEVREFEVFNFID
jgi:hypothetical protein